MTATIGALPAFLLAWLTLLQTTTGTAQEAPLVGAIPTAGSTLEANDVGPSMPNSTEQGHTPLYESFGKISYPEWTRETRREAFRDTEFAANLRTFCMDSDNLNGSQNEACALGGSAGFKTGYFRERIAYGATAYTSQRLYGPEDKDGTKLLAPGQQGYTVLGEAYADILLADRTQATIGLKSYDTPYLNAEDSLMTPNTFEGVAVQGQVGGDNDERGWRFGAGYLDKIKTLNSDEFVSMAAAAGAPGGVSRGVSVAGGTYLRGDLSIGGIDYYSSDIINIAYLEGKDVFALGEKVNLRVAAQYTDQRSVGDNLLAGRAFSAHQLGLKVEVDYARALLTAAYTATADGRTLYSPWGGSPAFTSVQVEDFERGGEKAFMLRAAYHFPIATDLSVYALYVHGSSPDVPMQYARDECDLNLQWKASASGKLRGLKLRARYGHVSEASPGGPETNQFRLIVYYDPP